jgi:putative hydrolase of the HAD superfamily
MIKAVLFDAGGVLHVSNTAQGDDLKQELGLTDEQLERFYSHYIPLLGTSKLTEAELWKEVQNEFGIREVSVDEHLFTRTFVKTLQKMPGMYELVDELKAKGIMVMLLTNVSPQFAEVLEQQGHYDPFDMKILSFEFGSWKPDPAIYRYALEKADIQPSEAIFIDDLDTNVEAAEKLGIHGIVFHDT